MYFSYLLPTASHGYTWYIIITILIIKIWTSKTNVCFFISPSSNMKGVMGSWLGVMVNQIKPLHYNDQATETISFSCCSIKGKNNLSYINPTLQDFKLRFIYQEIGMMGLASVVSQCIMSIGIRSTLGCFTKRFFFFIYFGRTLIKYH